PAATAYLQLRNQQLALCPGVPLWVDVDAFAAAAEAARQSHEPEAYELALALYGGELLPEEPYEEWASVPREALRRTHLARLTELARLHDAAGAADGAIEALRQVVAHDPTHEAGHVGLMRLYAAS